MDASQDYARVERAIHWIAERRLEQPGLDEVAEAMGLSPAHAQRVFSRWAGVSPKRFLGLLTLEHAKGRLRAAESVMGAAFEAGLSGGSRLHDLFVQMEAMTPGQYKAEGHGLTLRWGVHPTPFGDALLVASDRGLCRLAFLNGAPADEALAEARADWPLSRFVDDPTATAGYVAGCFTGERAEAPLRLLVKGSTFQVQVWRALLRIPAGATTSYGALARRIGAPGAVRAVGTACARNRLGVVIPCHRVIRETGLLGGYAWGLPRKQAVLVWEEARGMRAEALAA